MVRVLGDYDGIWLTLTAWAIFVYALAANLSAFFHPLVPLAVPAFGAAARARAARWRISEHRVQWYILLLLSGLAILGSLGTTYMAWALAHYCCP